MCCECTLYMYNLTLYHLLISEYAQLLQNAKAEGYITMKCSNLVVFGGSATGKTGLLNLLANEKPCEIYFFPAYFELPPGDHPGRGDPGYESEGFSSEGSSDTDDSLCEYEKVVVKMQTHIIVADEDCRNWKYTDASTIKAELLQAIKSSVPTLDGQNPSNNPETSKSEPLITKTKPPHEAMKPKTQTTKDKLRLSKPGELFKYHWIYTMDSGGQAVFIDLAHYLLRYYSTNIILVRLDEELLVRPELYYSAGGEKVEKGDKKRMTAIQIFKSILFCKNLLRPPLLKGVKVIERCGKPNFLVVGGRYDKYKELQEKNELEETLEKKNEYLNRELAEYEDVRFDYNKDKHEVIFPVNMLGRTSEEHEIAERIRKIVSQSYVQYEIPIRWFLFQLELKLKASNRGYMSINECYQIGETIDMTKDEVEAALCYFHDMSIYLYFHSILPSIVFINPQALLTMMTELVIVSFGCYKYFAGTISNLKEKGMFKHELLENIQTLVFDDIFTEADYVKLLRGLKLIHVLPAGKGYFLPLATKILDDPMEPITDREPEPLHLTWGEEVIPRGVMGELYSYLLSSECTEVYTIGPRQFVNRFTLKTFKIGGTVVLTDRIYALAVRYYGPSYNAFYIRNTIQAGFKHITTNWDPTVPFPEESFICKIETCRDASVHYCRISEDHKTLICRKTNERCPTDEEWLQCWYYEIGTCNVIDIVIRDVETASHAGHWLINMK